MAKEMTKVKALISSCLSLAMVASLSATAFAISPNDIGYAGSNVTKSENDGVIMLTLTGDAAQDLEVDGQTVVLDLAGHTLTNYTAGCATIYVKSGSLTIKDSG